MNINNSGLFYSGGKELTPGKSDCLFYGAASIALLAIGVLGVKGCLPPLAIGASFLALTIAPPLIILCRSKNAGAWSLFIVCLAPVFAGLGGVFLAGRISPLAMSGIALGVASSKLGILLSYTAKKI